LANWPIAIFANLLKELVGMGQFSAWNGCGGKFAFLRKGRPPQVGDFFLLIIKNVLILHDIFCKYASCAFIFFSSAV
jgi:hypothetical protein